jgi:acetyl-CoA acetyltransferase
VHDVAIGGGVEHMGHIPMGVGFNWIDQVGSPWPPELMEKYNLIPQGLSAEMIADQWEIPRSELDELAVRSHRLAHQATEEGRFERETIPFQVNGDTYVTDQGIRPGDLARDALPAQAGVQARRQDHGRQRVADLRRRGRGAAACRPTRPSTRPHTRAARIVDQTHGRVDPVIMLTGPIPATKKLLERNGMTIDDIDLIGDQRGVRVRRRRVARELEPDMDRVNVNGGAIALGHPLGSTGARLITTLLHWELERFRQGDRPRDDSLRRPATAPTLMQRGLDRAGNGGPATSPVSPHRLPAFANSDLRLAGVLTAPPVADGRGHDHVPLPSCGSLLIEPAMLPANRSSSPPRSA